MIQLMQAIFKIPLCLAPSMRLKELKRLQLNWDLFQKWPASQGCAWLGVWSRKNCNMKMGTASIKIGIGCILLFLMVLPVLPKRVAWQFCIQKDNEAFNLLLLI